MTERPIPFSAPMVRALLAGTKTQTRRVLKQATGLSLSVGMDDDEPGVAELSWLYGDGPGYEVHEAIKRVPCPYGQPGDRLWVREAFRFPSSLDKLSPAAVGDKALDAGYSSPWCPTQYEADNARTGTWSSFHTPPTDTVLGKLRPGMFMPRWASRITLAVTEVRVERLQDISDADAFAEGIQQCANEGIGSDGTARGTYRALWNQINGAGAWSANPWVWVVEFRKD